MMKAMKMPDPFLRKASALCWSPLICLMVVGMSITMAMIPTMMLAMSEACTPRFLSRVLKVMEMEFMSLYCAEAVVAKKTICTRIVVARTDSRFLNFILT